MCGICGVWEYGASEGSVESSLLARMRDEMTHRGPDDAGELIFDQHRGGFGFRRLSIIDLSAAGHQPMHGCDERTWLVFNGEIYNHALLRADLEKSGSCSCAIASGSSRFTFITKTGASFLLRRSRRSCNIRQSRLTSTSSRFITTLRFSPRP